MSDVAEPAAPAEWFYAVGHVRHGPIGIDELRRLAAALAINDKTLVWRDGMPAWAPAGTTELAALPELVAAPQAYIEGRTNVAARERWLAETPQGDPRTFTRLYVAWVVTFAAVLISYVIILWTFIASVVDAVKSGAAAPDPPDELIGRMLGVLGITGVGLLVAFVLWMLLALRNWAQVDDGASATTPGLAVGLSCIPCFNFYWSFVAVRGLAAEMNRVMDENGIPGPRPNVTLALVYCIANVCTVVPLVNYIAWPTIIVLGAIVYYELQRSGRRIFEWRVERARRLDARRRAPSAAPVL